MNYDYLTRCSHIGCGLAGRCDGVGIAQYPCPLPDIAKTAARWLANPDDQSAHLDLCAALEKTRGYSGH